jgi:hypothetical protein
LAWEWLNLEGIGREWLVEDNIERLDGPVHRVFQPPSCTQNYSSLAVHGKVDPVCVADDQTVESSASVAGVMHGSCANVQGRAFNPRTRPDLLEL